MYFQILMWKIYKRSPIIFGKDLNEWMKLRLIYVHTWYSDKLKVILETNKQK